MDTVSGMVAMPDEIRTGRLLLRRPRHADLDLVVDIHLDPATHPFDGQNVHDARKSARLLTLWLADWRDRGYGYWHVHELDGTSVGLGGIRPLHVDGEAVLNLYFRFWPSAWGRRYASEMARTAVGWAAEHLPERPVVIMTDADNVPAKNVAAKLGFVHSGYRVLDGVSLLVYRKP